MKTNYLSSALAVTTILSFLLFSCKKEQIDTTSTNTIESKLIYPSEVADDNWNDISKVPLVISSAFKSAVAPSPFTSRGVKTTSTTDVTPPTVSITSPSNGAAISGSVSISVSASDNVGVSSVSLTVDGAIIGSLTVSPFNFIWNSSTSADGTHVITATAKDTKNNSSSYSITVSKNTTVVVTPPPTTTLPSSSFLITPSIANQGNEGSCVAFSCAYGARSIEQFYRTNATSYSYASNIFSPEYAYNQTKMSSDCNSGTAFTLVLNLMQTKGVATWESMPYSDVNGCSLLPTTTQDANAANYKISSYSKIINSDQTAVKNMIYNHHAVMINVTMDNSFINATSGFIWKSYSGSGALPHAMIICGYDDSKHAYKVMNSVGTNWGDAGYSWIDYDYFSLVSSYYLYVMNY